MSPDTSRWAVAIFTARETPAVLEATVRAAIAACAHRQATIDVLINGNETLSTQFTALASTIATNNCALRVWFIAAPDKAHTWNEYIHRIWDTNSTTFFIDGYVHVKPEAFANINARLLATPEALAASGVPTCGRSAKRLREQMLRDGGLHGNLYAITVDGMNLLRNKAFRLPLGLYRNDGMLGSSLAFRLDPANGWEKNTVVVAEATWDVDGISDLSYRNIVGYLKRSLRQAQGVLENRAIREHMAIQRLPPQNLPVTAQEMANSWLKAQPEQARALFLRQPLCLYAARQLRLPRNWAKTQVAPVLLCCNGNERIFSSHGARI